MTIPIYSIYASNDSLSDIQPSYNSLVYISNEQLQLKKEKDHKKFQSICKQAELNGFTKLKFFESGKLVAVQNIISASDSISTYNPL